MFDYARLRSIGCSQRRCLWPPLTPPHPLSLRALQATSRERHDRCYLDSLLTLTAPLRRAESAAGRLARIVLVYGRSSVLPLWDTDAAQAAAAGERLCADAMYIHARPGPDNRPQARCAESPHVTLR